ncbi:cytidine deaminase-like protein [Xylaria bambusicola]|uniref:cytidine deaminase-like protein n=1 Tax=Xylaria bambusicola TaxID=326684 RepID=UPI002008E862|nr:cytidine deaminase-like protein [Xylaria bambusicola]KAI0509446.1 cytidine deaminase-like protein [Xylaria bambusicola]
MLIGICGAKCAGKRTVAQYLVEHHGFVKLHISTPRKGGEQQQQAESAVNGTKASSENHVGSTGDDAVVSRNHHATSLRLKDSPPQHTFASEGELLDYVTKHWRSRWVTTDIHSEGVVDALSRRPFFILISVDAPVTVRWQRHQRKLSSGQQLSLEAFVSESDAHLYSAESGVLPLMSRAAIRLLNTSDSLAHLYATLGKLDLTNGDRLRPSWDSYFMALASLAARRCNCMKRAVGCVLVDSKRRVISTGYNGTPRNLTNCSEGGCPRCNSGDATSGVSLATCLCLHAEENALLEAGRERIRDGSVLYCNTCPCLTCSIKIVQVGISEVVYSQGYSMDGETARVFLSAGVKLRQFSPPADGLIHLEKMEHNNLRVS